MGHLGFEPRTNRLKVGYSDLTELMSQRLDCRGAGGSPTDVSTIK